MSTGFLYFFEIVRSIYAMLKGFKIGIGDVSWIDFVFFLAFAGIVMKALVNRVTADSVASSASKIKKAYKEAGGPSKEERDLF